MWEIRKTIQPPSARCAAFPQKGEPGTRSGRGGQGKKENGGKNVQMRGKPQKPTHTHTHTHGCLCKIIFSSLAVFAIINPSYSTNISGSGNECNEPILGTDTGPATLRATWDANTININWYSDNTKITPTNNTANTCTYDSVITLPTNTMNKTGYTFGGWRVRGFDLSTLNASINGNHNYGHGWTNNTDYCNIDQTGGHELCSNSNLSDVGLNEWKTEFSYGTVYGEASCQPTPDAGIAYFEANVDSVVGGQMDPYEFLANYTSLAGQEKGAIAADIFTRYSNGTITYDEATGEIWSKLYVTDASYNKNSTGQYCWCKATGYKPLNGNKQNASSSLWVFNGDRGSAASCASNCARDCGDFARSSEALRTALFYTGQ